MSNDECSMARFVGATIATAEDVKNPSYYGSIMRLTFTDGRSCEIVGGHQYGAHAYSDDDSE